MGVLAAAMLQKRDFVAFVVPASGGTMSVTVKAWDKEDALKRLLDLGYKQVLSVS